MVRIRFTEAFRENWTLAAISLRLFERQTAVFVGVRGVEACLAIFRTFNVPLLPCELVIVIEVEPVPLPVQPPVAVTATPSPELAVALTLKEFP